MKHAKAEGRKECPLGNLNCGGTDWQPAAKLVEHDWIVLNYREIRARWKPAATSCNGRPDPGYPDPLLVSAGGYG